MKQLIECVPNISEGRNKSIIDAVCKEVIDTAEVLLLDVDPGADTNRTVITFVGSPNGVKEAAFKLIKKAAELIDMSKHKGEHPRQGATDVCPFVPVSGVTMDDCVKVANEVAKRVGDELEIPVYMYEYAATSEDRQSLAEIRAGEYEALLEKLKDPKWKPDYGPAKFNARAGATVIGAREFLIAYNVNLNTKNKDIVHNEIALNIRESGRRKRDANGKFVKLPNGEFEIVSGTLKACRAIGWFIEEYKFSQVSINLLNYNVTPVHIAFDECCKFAEKAGLRVTGSELVGLIPKEALLMAGKYYCEKQGLSAGIPEEDLIFMAIQSLGLSSVSHFEPRKKIIEYIVEDKLITAKKLVDLTTIGFVDETSRDSAAPGGGSVAALCGSLSAALSSMVANITSVKKGYEQHKSFMHDVGWKMQRIKEEFLHDIDKDTDAFNDLLKAFRAPKEEREEAIQLATKNATMIPFGVLKRSVECLKLVKEVARNTYRPSMSDIGVAGSTGQACAEGAFLNVKINTNSITDAGYVSKTRKEAEELKKQAFDLNREIQEIVNNILDNPEK